MLQWSMIQLESTLLLHCWDSPVSDLSPSPNAFSQGLLRGFLNELTTAPLRFSDSVQTMLSQGMNGQEISWGVEDSHCEPLQKHLLSWPAFNNYAILYYYATAFSQIMLKSSCWGICRKDIVEPAGRKSPTTNSRFGRRVATGEISFGVPLDDVTAMATSWAWLALAMTERGGGGRSNVVIGLLIHRSMSMRSALQYLYMHVLHACKIV